MRSAHAKTIMDQRNSASIRPEQEDDAKEMTAEKLRLINSGVSRSGCLKDDLKQMKQTYDVIYQP